MMEVSNSVRVSAQEKQNVKPQASKASPVRVSASTTRKARSSGSALKGWTLKSGTKSGTKKR
jgi:hypothetical protein